jgi:hypothetical protein
MSQKQLRRQKMNSQETTFSIDQIQQLEIGRNGNIMPRVRNLDYESTLKGSLLSVLYPGVAVACVLVPTEPLDEVQESLVRNTMANCVYKGTRYKLVGAASSAKKGLFYFVDENHHQLIAERFHFWPQAAMAYFGILVSACGIVADLPQGRILVVPDLHLGTNDCGGWIRESLAIAHLNLKPGQFAQFRTAFGNKQAKGSFKLMGDDVADLLDADIVIPESCVKPGLTREDKKAKRSFDHGLRFSGRIVVGIREISRQLEFESSYTLTQHAPGESIISEIIPQSKTQLESVDDAVEKGDYRHLLELIGHDFNSTATDEVGTVEGLLLADKSGHIVRHPWVNAQLDKLLARWTYKACTGGAYRLPAFALAHDGYLVARDGKIFHGSDWIPQDRAICSLPSKRGLCVRYPIRMYDDLLPLEHISTDELVLHVCEQLEKQGCSEALALAEQVAANQLQLGGTYTLNSKTAELNGGDFDFDLVGVIEEDRFPAWVRDRFARPRGLSKTKSKPSKDRHPWFNIVHVARKAVGNQIGSITDLITSCLADGRPDFAEELVAELQNALDSLKHGVEPDQAKIAAIRKEVTMAPWLRLKHERRVSDLPEHIEAKPTDMIAILYNHVRPHFNTSLINPGKLDAFIGLIEGEPVTEKIIAECHHIHSAYGAVVARIAQRKVELKAALEKARAEWDSVRNAPDKQLRKQKLLAKTQAQAAYYFNEERSKDEMKAIISFLKIWAQNKTKKRMAWAQALNTIVCKASPRTGSRPASSAGPEDSKPDSVEAAKSAYKPTGSLIYITFPQELVTRLAELTGGQQVCLYKPRIVEGFVRTDEYGRTFLVEVLKGKLKETFLFACRNGELSLDAEIPAGAQKQSVQAEAATEPVEINDPEGLGHEILDDLVFQAEYGLDSNANMEGVPF